MLNKCVWILSSFILFVTLFPINAKANTLTISAQSAIVMVASTGEVLYSKNEYEKRGIASTTKIMTCVVALENASLSDTVTVTEKEVNIEGTSIGLKAGDSVSLSVLLKGMLLESGNDAANATAKLVSGSKESFSVLMNEKAAALGMKSTSFKNPSGLTEKDHYSCAYDMALLGSYAIKNTVFRSICSLNKCSVSMGNPSYETTFYNHNRLLSKYDGAFGIKTGFTKASGRCLVSAVERGGVTLVAVTLNAYDDWNDHIKLYDYCFPLVSLSKAEINEGINKIPVINSDVKYVTSKLCRDIHIPYTQSVPEYQVSFFLPHFIYAGVKKGDYLGWVEVHTKSGILIGKSYIVADENAELKNTAPEKTLLDKILNFIEKDRR